RVFFSDVHKRVVEDGLEFWRGFFQSVRPSTTQLLINIDITTTTMYQSENVIDVSLTYMRSRQVRDLCFSTKDAKFRSLSAFLEGLEIRCRTPDNYTKTVKELVVKGGRYKFERGGHTTTTGRQEYFRSAHSIDLKFPDAFGIVTSGKGALHPIVYPAELCTILPGQLYKGRLSNHLTNEMMSFATMTPDVRLKAIMGGGDNGRGIVSPIQGYKGSKYIQESGMQISMSPLHIRGRMLPPPRIRMGRGDILPNNGAWNLRDQTFSNAIKLELWGVLNFIPALNEQLCWTYVNALRQQCLSLGTLLFIFVSPCTERNSPSNAEMANAFSRIGRKERIQMILVMLPPQGDPVYTQVKQWGDVLTGVPTQCLRANTVFQANSQYWANIALKMNARLGGTNYKIKSPAFDEIAEEPFMIMGAGVSHASPHTLRPSIASLVWSRDGHAAQYIAFTRVQHPATEGIVELKDMVKNAVLLFGSHYPAPKRILFFRNGISEGDVHSIGRREMSDVDQALGEVWHEKDVMLPLPKVTFIIVGKRHHVMFFPKDGEGLRDGTGNCKAGFVTTRGLENPLFQDFYLQSHRAVKRL
ncbi:hypothetical protein ARMSODRAFT_1071478, partial [Armillaria solidipes]